MASNSTSNMLAKMLGNRKNATTDELGEINDSPRLTAMPQSKLDVDMENALKNMIGSSFNKDHTPQG